MAWNRPSHFSYILLFEENCERRGQWVLIDVTKMNGAVISINNHLIELVEETPDTVITLTTGRKIIVKESRQEVKNLVKLYEREISSNI